MHQEDLRLTVLYVACLGSAHIGGPFQYIPRLIRAQQDLGIQVALLTEPSSFPESKMEFPIFYINKRFVLGALDGLPKPFNAPDLISFQCIYSWKHAIIAREALRKGICYIITPHGSLTRGAQSRKRWKKLLGNFLFQDWMNDNATAVHCLCQAEAADAREMGCRVFVVGNGNDLEVVPVDLSGDADNLDTELHLLFLGRLDISHKGLDILVKGLSVFRDLQPLTRVRLLIVGPDQNGSTEQLKIMVEKLGLTDVVEFPGPLVGQDKERVFKWAHLFVHTSRFEGQPLAVIEALAHGLPCILTPGTNMADLVTRAGAGWCAEPTSFGVASILTEVAGKRAALPQMGRAARVLAEREFNWVHIDRQMNQYYRIIMKRVKQK
jgi:glycosyltransferase involved in cell wall biosynthesis